MKTQKYLVTIEMPDGDMIGPGWIKDLLEADCDVEDVGRHKVSVEEYSAEYIRKDISNEAIQVAEDHAYFAGQEKFREKLLAWAEDSLLECEISKDETDYGRIDVYHRLIDKINSL